MSESEHRPDNEVSGCQNAPSDDNLEIGDLLKINGAWFIASKVANAGETDVGEKSDCELKLTSLSTGNKWSSNTFASGTKVSELEDEEVLLTVERHIQRGDAEINLSVDEEKAFGGEE